MGILQLNYIFFKEKGNLVVYGESHNLNVSIANCFQSYRVNDSLDNSSSAFVPEILL